MMRCKNFLKVRKILARKCLLNIFLQMAKTILLTVMITTLYLLPDTMALAFTRKPMKRNFTWSIRVIHLRSSTAFLSRLKFWFAKTKQKMNLRPVPTETSFCKLLRPCKNSRCFKKVVRLFNLTRIMLLA